MHVALVISSLSVGGAERVMSTMANYWVGKGWTVNLITLSGNESDHYRLDPRVERTALSVIAGSSNPIVAIANNARRLLALRRAIRATKAPMIISFGEHTNVLTLLACSGTRPCVVVSERTDPRHHRIGRVWNTLRKWTYPRAQALVVQTDGLLPWARTQADTQRIHVIENPVAVSGTPPEATTRSSVVLGVGRLVPQKGFDVFVRAFASVAGRFPDWNAVILGDGSERQRLTNLADELGIATRLTLPGTSMSPERDMAASGVFVLSSLHEGFPNALLEAMANGTPVISSDCPSGPGEIVHHGHDGLLVPPGDVERLASALRTLMEDPSLRATLGQNALAVRDRFQVEFIMGKWERLIQSCCFDRMSAMARSARG